MARTLHAFEELLSEMSMGVALTLKGRITPSDLKRAFELTKTQHPVLKMAIETADNGTKTFVEKPDMEMQLMCGPDGSGDSIDWREKLQAITNRARDHSVSLAWFEHYPSCKDIGPHVLFVVLSHAAADGRGTLQVLHSFCKFLSAIVSGNNPPEPEHRDFIDIIERYRVDQGDHIPKPDVPEDLMPEATAEILPSNGDMKLSMHACFEELTEDMTEKLIENSRTKGFTIQGALCASSMMAAAKSQEKEYPLPQKLAFNTPVDMRKKVDPPVGESHCVCGASSVWWWMEIRPNHTLAEVAIRATKFVHEKHGNNMGRAFAHWAQIEGWFPPLTVRATSMGINPIQTQYGDLQVCNVEFMAATYGILRPGWGLFMTHLHTFAGRLKSTHTHVAVSSETAELVEETQWSCLNALALDNADEVTVGEFLTEIS